MGLAIEYYNRKKGYNVGDIVRSESEFGIVTSQATYKNHRSNNEYLNGHYVNDIERDYSQYSDISPILKSGKAKKQSYGFHKVLDVVCKEKDFEKLCLKYGVKSILNKDNVTKLYDRMMVVNTPM